MKIKNDFSIFLLLTTFIVLINSCSKDESKDYGPIINGTVTDIDGNVYKTITVEISDLMLKSANIAQVTKQTWMVENLKTTKYRNGETIPNVTQNEEWYSSTGAYCHYNNDPNNSITYGLLYNWYAVMDSRNIAPEGWHVASDSEWMTLINFLGGIDVAGGKLKEAGTSHWIRPNTGAENSIGFTALPGGYRYGETGSFYTRDSCAYFWTTTEDPERVGGPFAYRLGAYLTSRGLMNATSHATEGYSVRCIKDN